MARCGATLNIEAFCGETYFGLDLLAVHVEARHEKSAPSKYETIPMASISSSDKGDREQ
jgi:hypothetical protein